MASLLKLWEQSAQGRDFWDKKRGNHEHLDEEAMQIISRGLEVRPDRTDGNTFWDDFMSVISNNSEGASKLLGVNRDTIAKWNQRIREGLKRIREENAAKDSKDNMTQTGTDV
jgi:cobalamin biosynthesis Mg chelatase CobN